MEREIKRKVIQLARELKKVLEENLPKDPKLAKEGMARAGEICQELNSMGIHVEWESSIDITTGKISVVVDLRSPKANMTEEEKKMYDRWFQKVNGIKPLD